MKKLAREDPIHIRQKQRTKTTHKNNAEWQGRMFEKEVSKFHWSGIIWNLFTFTNVINWLAWTRNESLIPYHFIGHYIRLWLIQRKTILNHWVEQSACPWTMEYSLSLKNHFMPVGKILMDRLCLLNRWPLIMPQTETVSPRYRTIIVLTMDKCERKNRKHIIPVFENWDTF